MLSRGCAEQGAGVTLRGRVLTLRGGVVRSRPARRARQDWPPGPLRPPGIERTPGTPGSQGRPWPRGPPWPPGSLHPGSDRPHGPDGSHGSYGPRRRAGPEGYQRTHGPYRTPRTPGRTGPPGSFRSLRPRWYTSPPCLPPFPSALSVWAAEKCSVAMRSVAMRECPQPQPRGGTQSKTQQENAQGRGLSERMCVCCGAQGRLDRTGLPDRTGCRARWARRDLRAARASRARRAPLAPRDTLVFRARRSVPPPFLSFLSSFTQLTHSLSDLPSGAPLVFVLFGRVLVFVVFLLCKSGCFDPLCSICGG